MSYQARCCCGQLSLVIDAEIKRTSMCHCIECQRRTGSVFGVQTRVPVKSVKISGEYNIYSRGGDEEGSVDYRFCPKCGSTVFWKIDCYPDDYIVSVGALAGSELPSPWCGCSAKSAHSVSRFLETVPSGELSSGEL